MTSGCIHIRCFLFSGRCITPLFWIACNEGVTSCCLSVSNKWMLSSHTLGWHLFSPLKTPPDLCFYVLKCPFYNICYSFFVCQKMNAKNNMFVLCAFFEERSVMFPYTSKAHENRCINSWDVGYYFEICTLQRYCWITSIYSRCIGVGASKTSTYAPTIINPNSHIFNCFSCWQFKRQLSLDDFDIIDIVSFILLMAQTFIASTIGLSSFLALTVYK